MIINIKKYRFLFLDGRVIYEGYEQLDQVKTEIYKDIINKIKPKIFKIVKEKTIEEFNKYCFPLLREDQIDETDKNAGYVINSIIFCLDKESTTEERKEFQLKIQDQFSNNLFNEKDLNLIQNFRLRQNIRIQYYYATETKLKEVPLFFTSFAPEGMTMNKYENNDPNGVKHSFRFDQVVDCSGTPATKLKAILDPQESKLLQPDDCCVSYLLSWNGKGNKIMICSKRKQMWKCKAEIKIIQSTMYNYCMTNKLNWFSGLRKRGLEVNNQKVDLLQRLAILKTMRLISKVNLNTFKDNFSYNYKLFEGQYGRNDNDFIDNLKSLNRELGSKEEPNGCKNFFEIGKINFLFIK